jgi:sarcosine oxidase, subunit beta
MSNKKRTIICRCEEITLEEVERAIDAGCSSVGAVKRYTRAGMGPCQGRGCGSVIAGIIAGKTGRDVLRIGEDKPRFPNVPLSLDHLSSLEEYPAEGVPSISEEKSTPENSLNTAPPATCGKPDLAKGNQLREVRKAIVIGGGYHGTSAASALAKAGVRTILLEQKEIGTGASGNNFGCIQLQDSNPGLSFVLNSRGFKRMSSMEKELGRDLEFREMGSLLYAQTNEEMEELISLKKEIAREGLQVELLEPGEMLRYEPYMDIRTMKGATYFKQANINPFKYLFALAETGVVAGLEIREHSRVEEILLQDNQCRGVRLSDGSIIEADYIVLAAGAWSRKLAAGCGIEIPVEYVIGEAFVSEPLQPTVLNFLSSASFFTATHGSSGPTTSFTAGQTAAGNILIGETSEPGPEDPDEAIQLTSSAHCRNMPKQLAELFPALKEISVMRSWTTCSPSTPDFEPFLGSAGPEGLIFATGFKSSVVISPVVGEIVSDLVVRGSTFCDISPFMNRLRKGEESSG